MKTKMLAVAIFLVGIAVGALASHVLAGRDVDGVVVRRAGGWIQVHRPGGMAEWSAQNGPIYEILDRLLSDERALHARDVEPIRLDLAARRGQNRPGGI